jgi:hypothetical protein
MRLKENIGLTFFVLKNIFVFLMEDQTLETILAAETKVKKGKLTLMQCVFREMALLFT